MSTIRQLQFIKKGVLEWREVEAPQIDGENQALIRPIAVARCDLDLPVFRGQTLFRAPFPVGHEFVGEVVQISDDLAANAEIQPGSKVVVPFQLSCGSCSHCSSGFSRNCTTTGSHNFGPGRQSKESGSAMQDLIKIPFAKHMLIPVPESIDPVTIASISDNIVEAYKMIGRHLLGPDSFWFAQNLLHAPILILGGFAASIGLYSVLLAKTLGATSVTYADSDKKRLEMAESFGADRLIGLKRTGEQTDYPDSFGQFSLIAEASGSEAGFKSALRSLAPDGNCSVASIFWSNKTEIPFLSLYNSGGRIEIARVRSKEWTVEMLDLIQKTGFAPERVTTRIAGWNDAPQAMLEEETKLILLPE